jgi:RHS repeat-associated protein
LLLPDPINPTGYVQFIEEYSAGGILLASYAWGFGPISQSQNGAVSHFLDDGLGSVRMLLDAAGNIVKQLRYDGYGLTKAESGLAINHYTYRSYRSDPVLGHFYLLARFYDPAMARFTREDPFLGLQRDPISLHRYVYARLDPLSHTDPSGNFPTSSSKLGSFSIRLAIIGALGGALSGGALYYLRNGRLDWWAVAWILGGAGIGAGLGGYSAFIAAATWYGLPLVWLFMTLSANGWVQYNTLFKADSKAKGDQFIEHFRRSYAHEDPRTVDQAESALSKLLSIGRDTRPEILLLGIPGYNEVCDRWANSVLNQFNNELTDSEREALVSLAITVQGSNWEYVSEGIFYWIGVNDHSAVEIRLQPHGAIDDWFIDSGWVNGLVGAPFDLRQMQRDHVRR